MMRRRRIMLDPDPDTRLRSRGVCSRSPLKSEFLALSSVTVSEPRSSWQTALPVLTGSMVTLRELRASDAACLFAMLTSEEVSRFISPPPASIDDFDRFIESMVRGRAEGSCAVFAVTLGEFNTPIGLFQVRMTGLPGTAEWGFAIGSPFWGTGVFVDSARLVADFVFDTVGVHRLEARSDISNARGRGALVKIGAVKEGILRRSLRRDGRYHDQVLYAIVEDDWRAWRGMGAGVTESLDAVDSFATMITSASIH